MRETEQGGRSNARTDAEHEISCVERWLVQRNQRLFCPLRGSTTAVVSNRARTIDQEHTVSIRGRVFFFLEITLSTGWEEKFARDDHIIDEFYTSLV